MANSNNYSLLKLNLVARDGTVSDLKPYFTAIEIYESLYDTFVTGVISLSDPRNLLEEMPIIGDETIEIEYHDMPQNFSDNKSAKSKTQIFDVVKVSDIKVMSPHNVSFTIHFISQSYLKDNKKRIRKAYTGRPCELTSDFVKRHLESEMNWITQCQYDEHIVFPNVSPTEAINLMCKLAVDSFGSGDYVFYESYNGFNFVTTEWLINQPVIKKYGNSVIQGYTKNAKDYKVEETYNTTPFDVIHNINYGMYGNRVISHNMVNKTITEKKTSYEETYAKFTHLNKKPLTELHKTGYDANVVKYIPTNPINTEGVYGKTNNWYGDTISRSLQFENNVWTLTINGDDALVAGGVIELDFPKRGKFKEKENDKRESGKYLILGLRRLITPTKYTSIIQVVGESGNV